MCLGNKLSTSGIDKLLSNFDKPITGLDNTNIKSNCEVIDIHEDDCKPSEIFTYDSGLNIMHLNIHSLRAKKDLLIDMIENFNECNTELHVIALCETYTNDLNIAECAVPGYNIIYQHRKSRKGGGVCILYQENLKVSELDINFHVDSSFEIVACKIEHASNTIALAEIYRAPNSDISEFMKNYQKLISMFSIYNNVVLCGDFNLDLLKSSTNKPTQHFVDLNTDNDFFNTIYKPTRVTHSTATLIDHIYVKDLKQKLVDPLDIDSAIVIDDISDHFPCILNIKNFFNHKSNYKTIHYRKITKDGLLNANHELLHTDWSFIENVDCNVAYDTFIEYLTGILDKHTPMSLINVKEGDTVREPWYTKSILKSVRKRKKLYKMFLCKGDVASKTAYTKYRNSLNRLIKFEKKKYFTERFEKFRHDTNVTWGLIKNLSKQSKNKKDIISSIKLKNKIVDKPNEIADHFNRHFTSICGKLKSKIQTNTNNSFTTYLEKMPKQTENLSLNPCNEVEIDTIIGNIKNKKSSGVDNISNYLMKELVCGLRTPLCIIANISIKSGIFPSKLKIAKVKPLFKQGARDDPNNYRPISLLPVFSKVIEKVILRRIQNFMNRTNQYTKNQFGFRDGSSTINACEKLTSEVLKCFNTKKILISVFIDLKKAFDTVGKHILLEKLKYYGFDSNTLNWFNSYLSDRKQLSIVNGEYKSNLQTLEGCLAQGSILSPELFLYMINDVKKSLKYSQSILFADDTTIYLIGTKIKFMRKKLQYDIDNLFDWLNCNELFLNVKKTKMIIFSENAISYDNCDIYVNGELIEVVNEYKFLGVIFDNKLSFEKHVHELCNRLKYFIYMFKMCNYFLKDAAKLLYYYAFIQSRLQYGIIIWWPLLNHTCKTKLTRIYHRCLDLLPPTAKLLTPDSLCKLENLALIYNIVNTNLHVGIIEEFNIGTHTYNTRNKSQPVIQKHTNDKYNKSFLVKSVIYWQELEYKLKQCQTIANFKTKCKNKLLSMQK